MTESSKIYAWFLWPVLVPWWRMPAWWEPRSGKPSRWLWFTHYPWLYPGGEIFFDRYPWTRVYAWIMWRNLF